MEKIDWDEWTGEPRIIITEDEIMEYIIRIKEILKSEEPDYTGIKEIVGELYDILADEGY